MTADSTNAPNTSNALSLGLFARDGAVFCNSRDVAKHFEKENHNVNKAIRNLIDQGAPCVNFHANEINDLTGASVADYDLTRDGFMLLVMGFTGADALRMKLLYIDRFNEMERMLATTGTPTPAIPQTYAGALPPAKRMKLRAKFTLNVAEAFFVVGDPLSEGLIAYVPVEHNFFESGQAI